MLIILIILLLMGINFKTIVKFAYPLKYEEYVIRYSSKYNVDPYLVISVINTESKFNERAISSKGAYGLMQIMPETGQWISQYVGISPFNVDMMYDPEISIKMGCWYLNNLSKEFNGNTELILAAYNGGRGNVNKWLSNEEYSKDGKTLHNIPFKETEEYVRKVNFSYKIYKLLYNLNENP